MLTGVRIRKATGTRAVLTTVDEREERESVCEGDRDGKISAESSKQS